MFIGHFAAATYRTAGNSYGKYIQPPTTVYIDCRNCREYRMAPCADGILDRSAPDIARMSRSV